MWNASPRPAPRPVRQTAEAAPPAPSLAQAPHIVSRPSEPASAQRRAGEAQDRERLTDLFTLASFFPSTGFSLSSLFGSGDESKPAAVTAGERPKIGATATDEEAIYDGAASRQPTEFIAAPAFDEEHPEELHYRPFPVAPLLTASSSHNDPVLAMMVAPDPTATIAFIEDEPTTRPMRFTPKEDLAVALWANQFTGEAVTFGFATDGRRADSGGDLGERLASRSVRTTEKPDRL